MTTRAGGTGTVSHTTPTGIGSSVNLRMDSGPGEVEITRSAVHSNALWSIPTSPLRLHGTNTAPVRRRGPATGPG